MPAEVGARDVGGEEIGRRQFFAALDMDQETGIETLVLLGAEVTERLGGAGVPERKPGGAGIGETGVDRLDLGTELGESLRRVLDGGCDLP